MWILHSIIRLRKYYHKKLMYIKTINSKNINDVEAITWEVGRRVSWAQHRGCTCALHGGTFSVTVTGIVSIVPRGQSIAPTHTTTKLRCIDSGHVTQRLNGHYYFVYDAIFDLILCAAPLRHCAAPRPLLRIFFMFGFGLESVTT